MVRALSEDLRKRVIEYIERGNNYATTSRKFEVPYTTVHRWYSRYQKTGSYKAKPNLGKKAMLSNEEFISYVSKHPNATLAQIGSYFGMSAKSAHYYMKKCKYSYKKKSQAMWKQSQNKEGDITKR